MTQKERILEHLLTKGKLSQKRAINLYGAYRLSAIIHVLRKEGYNIESQVKCGHNRYKDPVHWAEYKLNK